MKLSLWIALDVPDTDFQASLYEILPNGGSVFLTSDLLRARYRDSLEKETLVPKGEALRYDFTGFTWFSQASLQGKPAAPRGVLPQLDLLREELQLRRRSGRRDGEGRPHRPRRPVPRRQASQHAGDSARKVIRGAIAS